jgi:hypothetical protein
MQSRRRKWNDVVDRATAYSETISPPKYILVGKASPVVPL